MKTFVIASLGLSLSAVSVLADGHATGDAEAGQDVFRKCKACHAIIADDETVIERGGKVGPNLYGVNTRQAGAAEGFKYGDSIVAAGEAGLEWDEQSFVAYMADPKKFLAETLDDSGAKSKMAFKLTDAQDAADVWAYLVSVGPADAVSN